jgi:hypothetical protein
MGHEERRSSQNNQKHQQALCLEMRDANGVIPPVLSNWTTTQYQFVSSITLSSRGCWGGGYMGDGKLLKLIFRWNKKHPQICKESPKIYRGMFGPSNQRLTALYQVQHIRSYSKLGFAPSHAPWLPPMYKYMLQPSGEG